LTETVKAVGYVHQIETEFVYPPIPDRQFDWRATFRGYEPGDLMGYGPTELSAIGDLLLRESEQ
jgi:hypothetical protein